MSQFRRNHDGGWYLWDYSNNGWGSLSSELSRTPPGHRKSESPRTRPSLRSSSPLSLSLLESPERRRSPMKAQASHWSASSVPGLDYLETTHRGLYSTYSSCGSEGCVDDLDNPGPKRWHSLSRLAPEGAPRPLSPPGPELRTALAESGARRAELVRQLREAHSRLEEQTEHLRSRDSQLEASQAGTELLNLKHKQLALAVSALEEEKATAELCRFEESRRRGELQDKVLQLEFDMLKMRSMLERGSTRPIPTHSQGHNTVTRTPLSSTLPRTHEDFYKQGKEQAEREAHEAKEALRDCQERVEALEVERDQALQKLRASKEGQLAVLSQTNETNQRLTDSIRAQSDLQDELNDLRSHLSQATLEKDLLSSKVMRLEEKLEDLKAKLSCSAADRDRFLQEKAGLNQRVQSLELELERAQRGREGFTDQVSELHMELVGVKTQANRQDQEKVLMKEELLTVKQVNQRLSSDLADLKQKLETALRQLHELEAEKMIHTNQIAALETERSQLIGEREVLMRGQGLGSQEELQELRETCQALRDSQNALQSGNEELQSRCQMLEAGLRAKEVDLQQKEEEQAEREAGLVRQKEEMQRVVAHWKERWQGAAVALRSREEELEEARGRLQEPSDTSWQKEEALELGQELERLQRIVQSNQEEIQRLVQQRDNAEAELKRIKGKLTSQPEKLHEKHNRSQSERGSASLEGNEQLRNHETQWMDLPKQDKGTITESLGLSLEELKAEVSDLQKQLEDSNSTHQKQQDIIQSQTAELKELKSKQSGDIKASLEEVDGDLLQMRAELQKVWDVLKTRDSELEEQHQELESARGQVSECSSEMRRLEKELAEQAQELAKKDQALRRLERLRETEKTEMEIKLSSLELKLAEQRELEEGQTYRSDSTKCSRCAALEEPVARLEECQRRCVQLQQEKDQAVQDLQETQQGPAKIKGPGIKKEIRPENTDHERQRKLVTEQLKSLFKEREQLGKAYDKLPGARRGESSLQEWAPKSQVIKNALDTLSSQERSRWGLEVERERLQGAPEYREFQGLQEQVNRLREELRCKTDKMTSMNTEMENLKERNENLLKAKLRFQQQIQGLRASGPQTREKGSGQEVPHLSQATGEGGLLGRGVSASPSNDGTFLARQVEVLDVPGEEAEEHGPIGDSWSSGPPTPLSSVTLSQTSNILNLPTSQKHFKLSPDLSPLTPRSWAGSQESLTDKSPLLLSPQPYRAQTPKNSFRFGEK
ncbi:myosin-7B [Amia ocellicauda]|uniref:myosin-7B n=1 Tax=Amia ocellicauda TaxID=2972642 RepID=UPI00346480FC